MEVAPPPASEVEVPVEHLFKQAAEALGHTLSDAERRTVLNALGMEEHVRFVPASVINEHFARFQGGADSSPASPVKLAPASARFRKDETSSTRSTSLASTVSTSSTLEASEP